MKVPALMSKLPNILPHFPTPVKQNVQQKFGEKVGTHTVLTVVELTEKPSTAAHRESSDASLWVYFMKVKKLSHFLFIINHH